MNEIGILLSEIKEHLIKLETAQNYSNRLILICLLVIIGGGNPISSELVHRIFSESKTNDSVDTVRKLDAS